MWVKERRKVCSTCPLNTKNQTKLSFKVRVYKIYSDLLDKVMFAEKEDLGQCGHEECGCNIYFKTRTKEETCPDNKWRSIYIPNKK